MVEPATFDAHSLSGSRVIFASSRAVPSFLSFALYSSRARASSLPSKSSSIALR